MPQVLILYYTRTGNTEKMARLGRETRSIAIRYQHLPAVATEEKRATNLEFLVVGWDPEAKLIRRPSPLSQRQHALAVAPGEGNENE